MGLQYLPLFQLTGPEPEIKHQDTPDSTQKQQVEPPASGPGCADSETDFFVRKIICSETIGFPDREQVGTGLKVIEPDLCPIAHIYH